MKVQVEIDVVRNRLLLTGFLLLQVLQLALVPTLLTRDAAWGWLLLVPLALSNSWWAFMHESFHGHLFPDRATGRAIGRINAVLYGAAFDLLRWGHLLHHAYSRTQRERAEVYDAVLENRLAAHASYYFRLLGGLYVFELLGSLIFLLPRVLIRRLAPRIASPDNVVGELTEKLLEPGTLPAVRIDALAVLGVYATAFYCYGPYWWMLALALWGRGTLVSLMDNAFHYGTPLDQPRFAPDLAAPAWWSRILLNFNLHGLHHRHPAVPWHQLPELHTANCFQGSLLPAILSQFRGPIPEHALSREKVAVLFSTNQIPAMPNPDSA